MAIRKIEGRERRKLHIRKTVNGSPVRPRLSVFRSARHIYAQVIDDTTGRTLVSGSTMAKSILEEMAVAEAAKAEAAKAEIAKAEAEKAEAEKAEPDKAKADKAKAKAKGKGKPVGTKTLAARKVGAHIAKICKSQGIEKVVFDRNGYLYHGRIKALADAARKAGLEF